MRTLQDALCVAHAVRQLKERGVELDADMQVQLALADEIKRLQEECKRLHISASHWSAADEDNYYVYARLTQPDGNVWHGWSGYGVGAGLEDAGYGFSTADRESKLRDLWPESIVD